MGDPVARQKIRVLEARCAALEADLVSAQHRCEASLAQADLAHEEARRADAGWALRCQHERIRADRAALALRDAENRIGATQSDYERLLSAEKQNSARLLALLEAERADHADTKQILAQFLESHGYQEIPFSVLEDTLSAPDTPFPTLSAPFLAQETTFPAPEDLLPAPGDPVPAPRNPVPAPGDPVPVPSDPFPAPENPLPVPNDPLPAPGDPLSAPEDPVPAPVPALGEARLDAWAGVQARPWTEEHKAYMDKLGPAEADVYSFLYTGRIENPKVTWGNGKSRSHLGLGPYVARTDGNLSIPVAAFKLDYHTVKGYSARVAKLVGTKSPQSNNVAIYVAGLRQEGPRPRILSIPSLGHAREAFCALMKCEGPLCVRVSRKRKRSQEEVPVSPRRKKHKPQEIPEAPPEAPVDLGEAQEVLEEAPEEVQGDPEAPQEGKPADPGKKSEAPEKPRVTAFDRDVRQKNREAVHAALGSFFVQDPSAFLCATCEFGHPDFLRTPGPFQIIEPRRKCVCGVTSGSGKTGFGPITENPDTIRHIINIIDAAGQLPPLLRDVGVIDMNAIVNLAELLRKKPRLVSLVADALCP